MNLYEIDIAQIIIYHANDRDKFVIFFFGVRKDFDPKEKEKKKS